jgi:hypothetical protein
MGYEVSYQFYERTEDGYNRDEVKVFKKKVGDPFDDVSLEKLAGAIMAQLARRDVWIVDVEVFELSRKPISFKEAKGGIILKNKKFLFDGGGEDSSSVIVQDIFQNVTISPAQTHHPAPFQHPVPDPMRDFVEKYSVVNQNTNTQQSVSIHPHEQNRPRRPVDLMIFCPELHHMQEIKQKNLRLTPDKKYPIFEKRSLPMGGEAYLVLDDNGREQLVSDKYFVPNTNLFGDKELGFSQNQQQRDGGKLYWGGANMEPDMPDIRRR